jgi:XTP/dITP diphosphohydrolase
MMLQSTHYTTHFSPLTTHHSFLMLPSKTLFLGTNNRKKIIELVHLLEPRGFSLKVPADFEDVFDVDETGTTFIENARLKAVAQARRRGLWAIGEDSGLCVPALNGEPGVYSARFSGENANDQSNNALLLERMREIPEGQRQAYYVSTVVLADPEGGVHVEASGECWGRILTEARGQGGFGYDPLFEIVEYHQTFAEMGLNVKRAISHRARALRSFLRKLDAMMGI